MNHTRRVQRELEAAEAAERAFQANHAEQAAQAAQQVTLEAVPVVQEQPNIPPVVTAPAAPPVAPKEDFESKYNVLQGMYKADVTALKRQLSDVVAAIQDLRKPPEAPPAPAQPDQKDIETFGADLIAMVQRYAEGQQATTNARLDALEQRVGVVATQTVTNSRQAFFAALREAVPDYLQINADPKWLEWLGTVDPVFRKSRQDALNDAQAAHDVDALAALFNAFKATLPAAPPPEVPSPLAEQVTPSGAGSQAPTPAAPKRMFSSKAVTDFYNDLARGLYRGREAQAAALEAEIDLAVAQGRVMN